VVIFQYIPEHIDAFSSLWTFKDNEVAMAVREWLKLQ
jgi:hypothetical protein